MSNYEQRRDHRSPEEFAQHISDSTKKELYLAHRWQLEMQLRGVRWAIVPFGLDVKGEVNRDYQSGHPDFKLVKDGQYYGNVEIKNTPVISKATFKVASIKNILKHSSSILLFLNTGQITKHSIDEMDLSKAYWAHIEFHKVQQIMEDYKDKIFRWKPFGNKECVQILQPDYHKYFELHRFEFTL